ncbi:hypothetical protein SynBIOSU31_00596 [Synechococcus sp. BIOS-U3-1]|nr:hypothetical protein SynBIOSU31_00596 [Synechococcus sp. BIOS-U3-1]
MGRPMLKQFASAMAAESSLVCFPLFNWEAPAKKIFFQ